MIGSVRRECHGLDVGETLISPIALEAVPMESKSRIALRNETQYLSMNGYVGAGLGDPYTSNSSHSPLHHVVASVGKLDTLGKNFKDHSWALCPLSIVCHLAF